MQNSIPKNLDLSSSKPHAFDKRLDKSIAAAEIVLGPIAVKKLLLALIPDALDKGDLFPGEVLALTDPTKQLHISMPEPETGDVNAHTETKAAFLSDRFQGYTLVDIKSAIAAAIRDDLTGFVLQALQYKWDRELTMDDAENITFHLNKLIHLLK